MLIESWYIYLAIENNPSNQRNAMDGQWLLELLHGHDHSSERKNNIIPLSLLLVGVSDGNSTVTAGVVEFWE